jgi:hypothetical protein
MLKSTSLSLIGVFVLVKYAESKSFCVSEIKMAVARRDGDVGIDVIRLEVGSMRWSRVVVKTWCPTWLTPMTASRPSSLSEF